MLRLLAICLLTSCLAAEFSSAEIVGVAGGYDAPPPTLGPYHMTPFPLDDRPLYEPVMDVSSPLGGDVVFSHALYHYRVIGGGGWAVWGHGYTGDVYATGAVDEYALDLPHDTFAFYLYADWFPGDKPRQITAMADDGTTVVQAVSDDLGTAYFGFYQDDPAGAPIESITVSCPDVAMVAVGEFGIAIPGAGPGALPLLGVAVIGAASRRRRR